MDFITISTAEAKNSSKNRDAGATHINLDFRVIKSKDLMTRAKTFYAIWDEANNVWIKDEFVVSELIDKEIFEAAEKVKAEGGKPCFRLMKNYDSGYWQTYTSYIKNLPDNWKPFDSTIYFANDQTTRSSYATKKLPYSLEKGSIDNYDKLMTTLYEPGERDKLEWAIGAILTGDSKHIQKFITLYGAPGSGKSTFLNIVQKLVAGYYITFNAKDLVGHDAFGLEMFKQNPLVAIQHDGDLSKIEDSSTFNSIISHEEIVMNEKHKSKYSVRLKCFMFLGTNKPVSISDNKSGILRRLIDVHPSGKKLTKSEYNRLVRSIDFEIGAIADHCITKYQGMGEDYYKDYEPKEMMFETNAVYNFVFDNMLMLEKTESIQLKQLYDMYRQYCEETGEQYPLRRKTFRAEMKGYFNEFHDVTRLDDGKQARSVYRGLKSYIFTGEGKPEEVGEDSENWLEFSETNSLFDKEFSDIPAQYGNAAGTPSRRWVNCTTVLSDIDTSKLHYVSGLDPSHIVIDFDITGADGKKSLEKNLAEANKWPKTYGELSKSGAGIHLHYNWTAGKPEELLRLYSPGIEVKVFTGDASLRRKVSKCNAIPIASLSSGILFDEKKGGSKLLNKKSVEDERHLRVMIKKCMNKEFHGATKPECDFIVKLLDDAYSSGMVYDVSDMKASVLAFAAGSSNQAQSCMAMMDKMKWASEPVAPVDSGIGAEDDSDIVFYDVEVFKNLFLIVHKMRGTGKKKVAMVNPTPQEVSALLSSKLVGFNNKRYDDHILYARYLGYTNEQLYELSKKIITKEASVRNGFREAYSLAYTDVYDFAAEKMSLKKWEVRLGIKHDELEFDFNEPIPESLWPTVIEYCGNDVDATEAVFEDRIGDWTARKILADLANGTVNQTTNQLVTKIVFGNDRNPQLEYTNLEETFPGYEFKRGDDNKMHNMYRNTDVSFGGYVSAIPGMYFDVAILDIQSMHPSSIIAMNYFGKYTQNYADIKAARIAIKLGNFDEARSMLGGKLAPYLGDVTIAESLAYALKIALNSAYGLTSAAFENAMRDKRNVNNIVALRGALFMRTLQDEVTKRGFVVAHIKTDSIKIPNATTEIIDFCKEFARKYDYVFEHEATYEKMCLVNNAVYIAKYSWAEKRKLIGKWTATGAQFAEPYLFKTLFSKEDLVFDDFKQTKSVTNPAAMYLDFNEGLPDGQHNYVHVGKVGSFVPVREGTGGGQLLRKSGENYSSVTGTKGHRWKESDIVASLQNEDQISFPYFEGLADDAIAAISKYGDFKTFAELTREQRYTDASPIGFDEVPRLEPVANATIMKGV